MPTPPALASSDGNAPPATTQAPASTQASTPAQPQVQHPAPADELPTYSQAAKGKAAPAYRATEPPMKPPQSVTDPHPGDDERMAAMRAWAKEKEYQRDFYGGHKGMAVGEPTDPFKVLRWAKRKLSHKGPEADAGRDEAAQASGTAQAGSDPWSQNGYTQEYVESKGDMDTSKIA